jgi:hypothetical protein
LVLPRRDGSSIDTSNRFHRESAVIADLTERLANELAPVDYPSRAGRLFLGNVDVV